LPTPVSENILNSPHFCPHLSQKTFFILPTFAHTCLRKHSLFSPLLPTPVSENILYSPHFAHTCLRKHSKFSPPLFTYSENISHSPHFAHFSPHLSHPLPTLIAPPAKLPIHPLLKVGRISSVGKVGRRGSVGKVGRTGSVGKVGRDISSSPIVCERHLNINDTLPKHALEVLHRTLKSISRPPTEFDKEKLLTLFNS